MQVRVLDAAGVSVRFACAAGTATGDWLGELPPTHGADYDVELTHREDRLRWDGRAYVGAADGEGVLRGRVEQVDEDGIVVVRLGEGLVLLHVADEGPTPDPGAEVQMARVGWKIAPYNV